MTSSQPVTTPNAINFTPDNLHCYAYSGITAVDNNEASLIEFETNSEYLKAEIQITNASDTARDSRYKIYFNDVIIYQYGTDVSGEYGSEEDPDPPIRIIVPPFTSVKITAMNSENTDSINQVAILTGKAYGMTETGYQ